MENQQTHFSGAKLQLFTLSTVIIVPQRQRCNASLFSSLTFLIACTSGLIPLSPAGQGNSHNDLRVNSWRGNWLCRCNLEPGFASHNLVRSTIRSLRIPGTAGWSSSNCACTSQCLQSAADIAKIHGSVLPHSSLGGQRYRWRGISSTSQRFTGENLAMIFWDTGVPVGSSWT